MAAITICSDFGAPLIFLKRSLVFPILLFSSISLHWSLKTSFLSLLAILCLIDAYWGAVELMNCRRGRHRYCFRWSHSFPLYKNPGDFLVCSPHTWSFLLCLFLLPPSHTSVQEKLFWFNFLTQIKHVSVPLFPKEVRNKISVTCFYCLLTPWIPNLEGERILLCI